MITLTKGDILVAQAEALVNTVNCVGVMGRGVALQFKRAFPENFKRYERACKNGEVQPGKMLVFKTDMLTGPKYIINFPTKRHWRGDSKLEYIESGLADLIATIKDLKLKSIAIPPLGCGLGGLNWNDVRPRIEEAMRSVPDVDVLLFSPEGGPRQKDMTIQAEAPKLTPGRAVLVELMSRYLSAVMDPVISLLEVHKLMYFMQEAGENLRLNYRKAPYGPYAENLRHVLSLVEGHYIRGYGDAEDNPEKPIELLPEAMQGVGEFLDSYPETQSRFARVAKLIHGFETPFGMELLATVHWVSSREGACTAEQAVERTYEWNERKKGFSPEQIRLAYEVLQRERWLN